MIGIVIIFGSPFLLHHVLKTMCRPYRHWSKRAASINVEIVAFRAVVANVFEKYQERGKSEQFKKAYDLAGKSVRELEEALSVGMYREKREVFATAFMRMGVAVRVTASIGSPYRCSPADNHARWKDYVDRLACDEVRQYHNHPGNRGETRPSPLDCRTSQSLRSLLGCHGPKLRSLIVCWNGIREWKVFEHDDTGKKWLEIEFDAAVQHKGTVDRRTPQQTCPIVREG
jgi:hypothetical protein